MLPHFFWINYLRSIGVKVTGPRGRGVWWWAHVAEFGRGGTDHHADGTELIMYCVYEYKYTKYLIEHK
jgi:hypothetical protein